MARSYSQIPLGDNLADLAYGSDRYCTEMARQAMELGPIFRWRASNGAWSEFDRVSMIGPEANRFVMHTHRRHFSHDLGWTPLVGELFGKGLLNMDDPEHSIHRKMWNPLFAGAYMGTYLPTMQRVIEERTAGWVRKPEVDLSRETREITFDIATEALGGIHAGAQVSRMREHFYALLHGYDESEESFEQYFEKMQRVQSELLGTLIWMIQERRSTPPGERPSDVLSAIVHARDENGQALSDQQVLAHLMILLVAGHETTTTLATWALYLLTTMPEHRDRLMSELDEVLHGEPLTIESVRALKQLDYFVKETSRLYPPVINVPRGVVEEFEFNGYTVPAGAQVRIGLGPCHHLPTAFKDPERFDPDRFAPPREEEKKTPYSLVTFGGGPRICIGQHFATIEVKALVAHVLRNYELEAVKGRTPINAGFFNATVVGGAWVKVSPARGPSR